MLDNNIVHTLANLDFMRLLELLAKYIYVKITRCQFYNKLSKTATMNFFIQWQDIALKDSKRNDDISKELSMFLVNGIALNEKVI